MLGLLHPIHHRVIGIYPRAVSIIWIVFIHEFRVDIRESRCDLLVQRVEMLLHALLVQQVEVAQVVDVFRMVEEVVICLVQVLVDLDYFVCVRVPMGVKVLHLGFPFSNGLGRVIFPVFVFLPQ